MALLNLPPLAEFEKFLPSRFRGTGDPARTFIQAGFVLVPPGFRSPNMRICPDPSSRVKRFCSRSKLLGLEQVVGFGRLEICWSRRQALSAEQGLAPQLHPEPELGRQT